MGPRRAPGICALGQRLEPALPYGRELGEEPMRAIAGAAF